MCVIKIAGDQTFVACRVQAEHPLAGLPRHRRNTARRRLRFESGQDGFAR